MGEFGFKKLQLENQWNLTCYCLFIVESQKMCKLYQYSKYDFAAQIIPLPSFVFPAKIGLQFSKIKYLKLVI